MLKVVWLFHLCLLSLLAFTGADQEKVEHLTLYDSSPEVFQDISHTGFPIAVSVSDEHLNEVSSSVLMAESWVRTHIFSHYPSTNITTIAVGHNVLCNKNQEHKMGLVLPSVKNIYHSLTRWGLEREIKVSTSFSSNCLNPHFDFADKYVKPLLNFLQDTKSTYLVNPPPNLSISSDEELTLVTSHKESMEKLGFFNMNQKINLIITSSKESKSTSRKLSFIMDSKIIDPIPSIPNPLPRYPNQNPIGYSVPGYKAKSPLPPLVGTAAPPPLPPLFAPELPPQISPASPFHDLPPCNPSYGGWGPTGAPETGVRKQGMWCVAKPNVPAETLQEAMSYACGEGGADCEEIGPNGNCYYPNTVLAHASYAFNSYWQKNKRSGGTCSFGGTAMIINADPSFRHCRFMLSY